VISPLAERLLDWYAKYARRLPWREHPDPYAVWVSEIMLQQTRIETVVPYFQRWMERFPDLESLSDAPLQEVLSAWEGLGYYSRARNLQLAAKVIVANHGGKIPQDVAQLRKLPGIGRYTAGAIASIAFEQDEPALDGNIRRVLARVFNVREPARSPAGERRLWELAALNLPAGKAGDYNQALMDLGAIICTPRSPACSTCPLSDICQAFALGVQAERPVLSKRSATPHYTVTAAVIQRAGEVLIAQRPLKGLLGGLWEFPGGKLQPGEDLVSCLQREICEELGVDISVGGSMGVFHHAYTHFRVTLHAFSCELRNGDQPHPIQVKDLRWVSFEDLRSYPMGKIDRQIADRLLNEDT
jgi:A/G-specific adenine glycosylase